MLNDPYIEVIRKTRGLKLDEKLVEHTIDLLLKTGSDKTFLHLVHDSKIPEADAWALIKEIKKEFRSSYYQYALYAAIFMLLFLFLSVILIRFSDSIGFWMIFCLIIFLYSLYSCAHSLVAARKLR